MCDLFAPLGCSYTTCLMSNMLTTPFNVEQRWKWQALKRYVNWCFIIAGHSSHIILNHYVRREYQYI